LIESLEMNKNLTSLRHKHKRFEHLYSESNFNPFNFASHLVEHHRFYKYRSNQGDVGHQFNSIANLEIWFASPRSFNDPFDCFPASHLHSENTLEHFLQLANYHPEFDGMNVADVKYKIQSMCDKFPSPYEEDEVSVLCLSKKPTDHRSVRPVTPSYNDPLENYLYKSSKWKHEKEHRIFRMRKNHVETILPEQLKSVIFGCRVDGGLQSRLKNLIEKLNKDRQHKICTYQAKISKTKYEIFVPGHDLFDLKQ